MASSGDLKVDALVETNAVSRLIFLLRHDEAIVRMKIEEIFSNMLEGELQQLAQHCGLRRQVGQAELVNQLATICRPDPLLKAVEIGASQGIPLDKFLARLEYLSRQHHQE